MSAEKLSNHNSKESLKPHEVSKEHLEKLDTKLEKEIEQSGGNPENDVLEARRSIEQQAVSGKETMPDSSEKSSSTSITKAEKTRTYKMTMNRMQSKLSPTSKSFSKFIHTPFVEKSSEVLGASVARPSGILGAGIIGFVGFTTVIYFAKRNGFEISNRYALVVILFVGGWALGLLVELVIRALKKATK